MEGTEPGSSETQWKDEKQQILAGAPEIPT